MNIGVPRERRPYEFRVGLSPMGVSLLTTAGHRCFVETDAGLGSGFDDMDYARAGAQIVYTRDEAYGRAEVVLKVARPTMDEIQLLADGQALLGILHMHSARPEKTSTLLAKRVTVIAYEQIELDDGTLPVLKPLSQIGGRMTAQIAADLLQNGRGGKGILLGGVAGVPPAEVVIIGAGNVGTEAAQAFLGLGAHVTLLDRDLARLQAAEARFEGRVTTLVSYPFNVERVCKFADVLVGAVRARGERAPILVTRETVRRMKPRAVVMDLSIDEGGCVETSRPTTHDQPTFLEEGVIHYCVPNVPGVVARTATHAFLNAAWPYIQAIAEKGVEAALAADPALRRGLIIHHGKIVAKSVDAEQLPIR
jgi:alanine dehydrogenase